MTRICSVCKTEKPASGFYREHRSPDGLAACCRLCIKDIRKGRHHQGNHSGDRSDKQRARERVRDAVRYGRLVKPDTCARCKTKTPAHLLDGHHADYSKPLDVVWLCRSCHGLESTVEGGVEGHAIPRTTSATTTRYPATEGEEHMVATARRAEEKSSTKTGQAGIESGPSEPHASDCDKQETTKSEGGEKEAAMTEEQIKHIVDRFLGWKLPRDTFNPDCGISFDKEPFNTHTPYPSQHEPSGTNLFDATQATAMVRYMLEGLPRPNASTEARLREALEEAGKGARDIRNELDRTRADRDSWKQQFESASAAASEYSEFWEKHSGEFDQFGNYIPHNQIDGDLRAAKDEIERLKALSAHPHASDCDKQGER